MKLPVETWVQGANLDAQAESLVLESGLAYKAGAYRGALILAYLGFLRTIRLRLLAASAPAGFQAPEWTAFLAPLNDDKDWDPQAFKATQQKNKVIFPVPDEIRREVEYWRDRRNDCAHHKSNEIGPPHVEGMWMFLRSNLPKFVVNGSRLDLLRRISDHFNPSLTPVGSDPSALINLLPLAVPAAELSQFFAELEQQFTVSGLAIVDSRFWPLLGLVFELQDQSTMTAAAAFVRGTPQRRASFLRACPSRLLRLQLSATDVRRLWHDDLPISSPQDLDLLCALLRNGMIPAAEVSDAIKRSIERWANVIPLPAQKAELDGCGFRSAVVAHAFAGNHIDKFNWGNPNRDFLCWFLDSYGLDDDIVRSIARNFSGLPYAHHVCAAFQRHFVERPLLRQRFRELAQAAQVTLPALIPEIAAP